MAFSPGRLLWAAGLVIASGMSGVAAQEATTPPRLSAFYFPEELDRGTVNVAGQPAAPMGLHASAIRTGAGGGSIWINGLELQTGDRLGPVEIVKIEPTMATLRLRTSNGAPKLLRLALNQFLTLPASLDGAALEDLSVREGAGIPNLRQRLPRVRLP